MEPTPPPKARRQKSRLRALLTSRLTHIVLLVTGAVVVLMLLRLPITEFIELKLYDLKFLYRGERPASGQVVIVTVDDDSVKEVGAWTWPREITAEFLKRLKEAEPAVVSLDIIFAERAETAAILTLRRLRQGLTRQGSLSGGVAAVLQEEEKRADVDRRLAEVVGGTPPTILGFFFRNVGGVSGDLKAGRFMGTSAIQASTYNMIRLLDQDPERLPTVGAQGVEVNLPQITEAAAGGGFFNMVPDVDGTVRWLYLGVMFGPDIFAPLSLVTVQHAIGKPPLGITLSRLGVEQVRLGRHLIPVDRFGRFFINYLGPPGAFKTISAADVLKGRVSGKDLKDKIVLVGATAEGIYDLRVTPFRGIFPGIEIQATVIDNILTGNFLQLLPLAPVPGLLTVIFLGVLLGVVLPRLSAAGAFIFALLLVEAYVVFNYLLFRYFGLILELFYPLVAVAGVYTGVTIERFLTEEKERARLKKAFQSYVAPTVVDQIIRHPERLVLGGERRVLSILFCDIRGFTTLSEELEPEALVGVLHDFLNPMSDIIVEHGGTIDKYMGDAIMALFNAPLDLPDHARRACQTALDMVAMLRRLDKQWEGLQRPSLRIGVGINTGWVAVGNMGSDRLFDYTAVGDNVNLASRLEGLNKHYDTEILISEATALALDGGFALREVDRVQVKGKTMPLSIYEVLAAGPPEGELRQFLEWYHQGLAHFRERRFAEAAHLFTQARELRPADKHLLKILYQCREFQVRPPGPDWQAATVMDQK
ncbi:MAG: CHASE2 domain-containing protein [Deltaproteobacteria bacterium]|nr:CHASE2 domain-containing protein [Deltaproteobacteria bacterium]